MLGKVKSVFDKVKCAISKLPFNNLVSKIPVLAKFSGYANYAASAVALLILGIVFSPSNNVKAAVKELKKVNDETARFWITMIKENGIDAIYEKTTLLKVAVDSENYNLVKACIKSGANVNLQPSEWTFLPIVKAIYENNAEIVKLLIKNKATLVVPYERRNKGDAVDATLYTLDENIIKLVLTKVPKSELNFLYNQNNRNERIYDSGDKKRMNTLINLINNYEYKTAYNFDGLLYFIKHAYTKDIPPLIKAIKTTALETYHKEKYKQTAIYYIEDWRERSKLDKTSSEEIKVQEQIEELISWLEKQGYERKGE